MNIIACLLLLVPLSKVYSAIGKELLEQKISRTIPQIALMFERMNAMVKNPWTSNKKNSLELPLEKLAPLYSTLYLVNQQSIFATVHSPIMHVHKSAENDFKVVSRSRDIESIKRQSFVPFKAFHALKPEDAEIAKTLYLMLSMSGKCNQIVCSFGLVLPKLIESFQLTFKGERIVGWSIHDGDLQVDHSKIMKVEFITPPKDKDLNLDFIRSKLTRNEPFPENYESSKLSRTTTHVWICFTTESGKVYDLDLSSWQFGTIMPFPCIERVDMTSKSLLCLNGICVRRSVCSVDEAELNEAIDSILENNVELLNKMSGTKLWTEDMLRRKVDSVNHGVMVNLSKYARGMPIHDFDALWKDIKNL